MFFPNQGSYKRTSSGRQRETRDMGSNKAVQMVKVPNSELTVNGGGFLDKQHFIHRPINHNFFLVVGWSNFSSVLLYITVSMIFSHTSRR